MYLFSFLFGFLQKAFLSFSKSESFFEIFFGIGLWFLLLFCSEHAWNWLPKSFFIFLISVFWKSERFPNGVFKLIEANTIISVCVKPIINLTGFLFEGFIALFSTFYCWTKPFLDWVTNFFNCFLGGSCLFQNCLSNLAGLLWYFFNMLFCSFLDFRCFISDGFSNLFSWILQIFQILFDCVFQIFSFFCNSLTCLFYRIFSLFSHFGSLLLYFRCFISYGFTGFLSRIFQTLKTFLNSFWCLIRFINSRIFQFSSFFGNSFTCLLNRIFCLFCHFGCLFLYFLGSFFALIFNRFFYLLSFFRCRFCHLFNLFWRLFFQSKLFFNSFFQFIKGNMSILVLIQRLMHLFNFSFNSVQHGFFFLIIQDIIKIGFCEWIYIFRVRFHIFLVEIVRIFFYRVLIVLLTLFNPEPRFKSILKLVERNMIITIFVQFRIDWLCLVPQSLESWFRWLFGWF